MPWLTERTIRKYVSELREDGWIKTANLALDKRDRTLFYTVVKEKYDKCKRQIMPVDAADYAGCKRHTGTDVSISTKTQTQTPTKTQYPTPAKKAGYTLENEVLAKEWLKFAQEEMPWQKRWSLEAFAKAIGKLQRVLDLNDHGLKALLDFIRNDPFWVKNAVSPLGLLVKSKNGNRKIDNILVKMRPQSDRQRAKIDKMEDGPDFGKMTDDELTNVIF